MSQNTATRPATQERGTRPYYGPVALLHGIAFDDQSFLAIEEPADFAEHFGADATLDTAAAFVNAWGREVDDAWRDAVATWSELRAEERSGAGD